VPLSGFRNGHNITQSIFPLAYAETLLRLGDDLARLIFDLHREYGLDLVLCLQGLPDAADLLFG